jgi:catechol 2,3-dioxygenase-like lactoylglutathione lyase family enzyme
MFDHVGIAVSDLAASERFYRSVLSTLGVEPTHADAAMVGWEDWWIGPVDAEHRPTRGLHIRFRADAGALDGVLLDPDGNALEAPPSPRERFGPGWIDHLELRVRDSQASRRFYATIAPFAGLRVTLDTPDAVRFSGSDFSLALVRDDQPLTEHVHIAFSALTNATVCEFHAAALAAGYRDHGAPGERRRYHPGYYGAFVLDPDGHNIEVVNHNG